MNLFRMIFGGVKEISNDDYCKNYQDNQHILLDVRNSNEYSSEHMQGAQNIPFAKLPKKLNELPKDQPVIVVCRSGPRGREAAHLLQSQGYDVANLVGGIHGWKNDGLNLVRAN
jgi:rhodanese-related sulfurtransferase